RIRAGGIVASDTPDELRARLGQEIVELRVNGDAAATLRSLRECGLPVDEAFAIGSTLTIPLDGRTSSEAIAVINDLGVASAISTRQPTLDDVYLRLTGDRLPAAARPERSPIFRCTRTNNPPQATP